MQIFNLIKTNKYCKDKVSNQIDNVNAVRLLISCATEIELELLPKQTFWGTYKETDKKFGKLEKIN